MKKVLVRVPQWLGDAVVSTVFLRRLKQQRPDDKITVLSTAALAPIFETHPAVEAVIKLPYPKGTVVEAAKLIRAGGFDEAYILPRSFRAALECFLAKIPVRIGYAGDMRRLLLTRALPYDEKRLYAHRHLALIGEETFPLNQISPYFPSAQPVILPSNLKKPVLGLAPVSIAPSRTWSADRFIEVANRFQAQRGGTVILFGSAAEREAIEKIKNGIQGSVIDTAGGLKLPELGWMMQQCEYLVANDSGLMHVASCFQIPTAVIFGASDPAFALPPWGKFIPLQHKEIFCVPCLRNQCVRFGNDYNACLKAVTGDEVLAAIDSLRAR